MNPRTTAVLAALVVGLGAFLYFYEIGGEEGRRAAADADTRIFANIEPDDVEWIALTADDGSEIRVERTGDGWRVRAPLDFPGDDVTLDGMASTLAQLTHEARLEDPQPAEVYGLGDAARVVRFSAGGEERALRVGRASPVGANSYVGREGDEDVFTVATWRVTSLHKDLDALRDRRVAVFDRASVRTLRASWPGGGVELEKGDAGWRTTAPLEGAADEETIDALLSDLSFLRADGFEDAPPADEEAGLAEPDYALALTLRSDEGAERVLDFALGSEVEPGVRLARGEQPSLYRLPADRIDDFPRELVAYRYKQLARFDTADAQRLEIAFADGSVAGAERGQGGWRGDPRPLQPGRASGLLAELSRLKASTIVAESMGDEERSALGLAPARVTIRAWSAAEEAAADELLAEVWLGNADPARGIAAMTPGSDVVYRLAFALAESLPITPEAFENRFVDAEAEVAAAAEAHEAADASQATGADSAELATP